MSQVSPPAGIQTLPPQLWLAVRQRDATQEAAVKICKSQGEPVPRLLLPAAPPPVAAFGEVRMTREERMHALGCMGRAMVMYELAHGAGMPFASSCAAAQKTIAAIVKRDAATRAAAAAWAAKFPFNANNAHKAHNVFLSPDRLAAKLVSTDACAWVRSERGVIAGCGVERTRWAVQLGLDSGGHVFSIGVASDDFSSYTEGRPRGSWFFQNNCTVADGRAQGHFFNDCFFNPPPFAAGDVVTVELERAPGVDGVLRVRVAGKTPRELRGLPKDGTLYPIVGLANRMQSYTMVALP